MTNVAVSQFESLGGEITRPAINRPWSLHRGDTVWLVETGRLDVFLAGSTNGEIDTARRPLLRVEEGEIVLGWEAASGDGIAVFAAACPGTQVRCAAVTDLLANCPEAESLVAGWLSKIASVCRRDNPPRDTLSLDDGQTEVRTSEKSRCVAVRNGVAWVRKTEGSARLFGRDKGLLPESGTPFALARNAWLRLHERGRLEIFDWNAARAAGWIPEAVAVYRQVILALWCADRERDNDAVSTRAKARHEHQHAVLESALTRLASPLNPAPLDLPPAEGVKDPFYLACFAVGRAQGIEIRPHPDLLRNRKLANPIAALASSSGVRFRRVALQEDWWNRENGPMLCTYEQGNRPVAVLPKGGNRSEVYDPSTGARTPLTEQEAGKLSALAYVFYRGLPARRLTRKDIVLFAIAPCSSEIRWLCAIGLLSGLLALATPVSTGLVFDRIIPGADRSQLFYVTAFLCVGALASSLFEVARGHVLLRMEAKMDSSLQAAVWDRLLSLPVPFFRDFGSGDLASRSLAICQMSQALTSSTLSSLLSSVFSVFSFALMFVYSWRLALVATVLVGIFAAASAANGYRQMLINRELAASRGRLSNVVLQCINGIAKFRVSGTEHQAFANWAREFSAAKQIGFLLRSRGTQMAVFGAIFPIVCSVVLYAGYASLAVSPLAPALTTGQLLAFNAAFSQFLVSLLSLTGAAMTVVNVLPMYERCRPILDAIPEVDLAKTQPGQMQGRIEVSHVSFRYRPDAPLVLRDVSIAAEPGQFVAIVGASGCGKSTLFRLLLGFEKPEAGAVYYDGQDLAGVDIEAVRRQLGVVIQASRLISGDIFTNIVGASNLSLDDAWHAAELAGIAGDIKVMPMGLHTLVSEGGSTLSGGQRQRLMIARAIVRRPRIILFDEATSALDNANQAIVSRSLESLQATRIVVAHRLSTIVNADKIYVLNKGCVEQCGSFQELLNQDGLFRELAQRQIA